MSDPRTTDRRDAAVPAFLRPLHTDEWGPQPRGPRTDRVHARTAQEVIDRADGQGRPAPVVATSRMGTAIGLRALNEEWGHTFFDVPEEAAHDEAVAAAHFEPPGPVIDVQTHFLAPHSAAAFGLGFLSRLYRSLMPDWWTEMDDIDAWTFAEYLHNVFVESHTAVAVLTSGPGLGPSRNLFNHEMSAARLLLEGAGGTGRLLNHAVVHADQAHEVSRMLEWRDEFRPVGWKVYTPGRASAQGWTGSWMLDDERHGLPFLERVREVDVKLVCAHKGISQLADNGSPRDVGPAARAFPDIDFVIYHSGYELPLDGAAPEGPYRPDRPEGVDRLIASVAEAGLAPGSNVYAELGSTWFALLRRPVEAAHVLGKLLTHLGPDNVIWGTDSIWFGSPQPLIDAFRRFRIPEWMCEEFGYPPITDEVRARILGGTAARVYGLDLDAVGALKQQHDRTWAHDLAQRYRHHQLSAFR